MRCLLCDQQKLNVLSHSHWNSKGDSNKKVPFYHCLECDLIFRDPQSFPDWGQQRERYSHHHNSGGDPHYVQYFQQLIHPLVEHLHTKGLKTGLDWGCGPGPVLSEELKKLGFQVQIYDPIYFPEKPQGEFDFITSTEVIEHFLSPKEGLDEILKHVKNNGIFAGMTNFHQGPEHFSNWWYAKDLTHVCFYSEKTLYWIEKKWRLRCLYLQSPNFIFFKN